MFLFYLRGVCLCIILVVSHSVFCIRCLIFILIGNSALVFFFYYCLADTIVQPKMNSNPATPRKQKKKKQKNLHHHRKTKHHSSKIFEKTTMFQKLNCICNSFPIWKKIPNTFNTCTNNRTCFNTTSNNIIWCKSSTFWCNSKSNCSSTTYKCTCCK